MQQPMILVLLVPTDVSLSYGLCFIVSINKPVLVLGWDFLGPMVLELLNQDTLS